MQSTVRSSTKKQDEDDVITLDEAKNFMRLTMSPTHKHTLDELAKQCGIDRGDVFNRLIDAVKLFDQASESDKVLAALSLVSIGTVVGYHYAMNYVPPKGTIQ